MRGEWSQLCLFDIRFKSAFTRSRPSGISGPDPQRPGLIRRRTAPRRFVNRTGGGNGEWGRQWGQSHTFYIYPSFSPPTGHTDGSGPPGSTRVTRILQPLQGCPSPQLEPGVRFATPYPLASLRDEGYGKTASKQECLEGPASPLQLREQPPFPKVGREGMPMAAGCPQAGSPPIHFVVVGTAFVLKFTCTKHSGMCESQMPWRVQTQPPESFAGGASL